MILTEHSEVDSESRRQPAVTVRAHGGGPGANPLVVAVGEAASRQTCVISSRCWRLVISLTWLF